MTRILRAAGIAAASLAFCASATLAAPTSRTGAPWLTGILSPPGGEAEVPRPVPPPSLDQLVQRFAAPAVSDRQQDCLANAVYFESRGEPVLGQLAVANVVLNRAASGHYPADLCGVVTQNRQFSFVRHGHIPAADRESPAWRKAVAIAHIAEAKIAEAVPGDVLWYHAAYVAPSWRHGLNVASRIGLHIFYS